MEAVTAAQIRLRDELFAWDAPRPIAEPGLAEELRNALEDGARAALARHGLLADGGARDDRDRYGKSLFVSKSRLDRLVCDGLYRGALEEKFRFNRPIAVGTLSHLAIQRDHDTRRALAPEELVDAAWHEASTRPRDALATYCNELNEYEAASVRQEVEQHLTEHRDVWPQLDSWAQPRFEQSVRAELVGGRVVLLGTPDLTLGRVRDATSRMLLVDLKTGMRRPAQERQELRFYALLLTLKHRQPPYRWASYYVAEGAWDVEDMTPEHLWSAVRRTIDGIDQAARLLPADAPETLQAGRWCRFCPRKDRCPEYLSQGEGTLSV
ncbi:MAG: hypothetical protein ACJA2H_000083 [Nitriliruptoraceae bacterium]|jgi:hypothetical protein